MEFETKIEKVKEILNDLYDDKLVEIWNEYQRDNYYDDEILSMDFVDDYVTINNVTDAWDKIDFSSFNINDDYFMFTIYGIKSFNNARDEISIDDLVNYVVDNELTFDIDELEELFEEDSEEDDEED